MLKIPTQSHPNQIHRPRGAPPRSLPKKQKLTRGRGRPSAGAPPSRSLQPGPGQQLHPGLPRGGRGPSTWTATSCLPAAQTHTPMRGVACGTAVPAPWLSPSAPGGAAGTVASCPPPASRPLGLPVTPGSARYNLRRAGPGAPGGPVPRSSQEGLPDCPVLSAPRAVVQGHAAHPAPAAGRLPRLAAQDTAAVENLPSWKPEVCSEDLHRTGRGPRTPPRASSRERRGWVLATPTEVAGTQLARLTAQWHTR